MDLLKYVLIASVFVASTAAAQDVPTLNAGTVSMDVDGIDVIFKSTPGTPIATVTVLFDGGTLLTEEEDAGLESFTLALAAEGGPDDMTKAEFQAGLDGIGSSISASAGFDSSSMSMHTIVSEFDTTWNVLIDLLEHPAFRSEELVLAREEHLSSLRSQLDDADSAARVTVREDFYAGHPYAIRPQGFEETVASFDEADLEGMMARLLVRERITVVIVGDLEASEVEFAVREGLAFVPSDPTFSVPEVPPVVHEAGHVTVLERADLPTNYILGYFPMPSMDDPDYAASRIAIAILHDRLFEEVRTRRNLSYAVQAAISSRRANNGALYVTATDPETTIGVMYATIDEMIANPVSAQDLTDQVEGYLTHYYMSLQSADAQAALLGRWELFGGGREQADAFIAAIQAVTPEDVSRVLETYINHIQFGVVGDPSMVPEDVFSAR